MTNNPFQKAVKTKAKIRLAIDGPSGSGKTYTALIAATSLADGGKIAVIDTERGSAALYSDKFSFDTATLDTFSPQSYVDLIHFAEGAGYSVIVIDSLSHAWEGEGGVLDMHDQATKRQKTQNSYTAWADVTPQHRSLIDAMLQSKCHIIATMRSKMEYVQEKNSEGRTVIRKVGMAPIQRQGMEYEFTIVGDMDLDHNFSVSKSRMDKIADAVVAKPSKAFFDGISQWIGSGEDAPVVTPVTVTTTADRAMTLDDANETVGSDGVCYKDRTTAQLSHVFNNAKAPADKREAARLIIESRGKFEHAGPDVGDGENMPQ